MAAYLAQGHEREEYASQPEVGDWVEPISERDIDIPTLIAKALTNQEIAVKAYLSSNTVKVHTRKIYKKFSGNIHTQANAKARTLGIF